MFSLRLVQELHISKGVIFTNNVQHFQAVDKIVDFPHEAFHENDLREANDQGAQFCRESLRQEKFSLAEKNISLIW